MIQDGRKPPNAGKGRQPGVPNKLTRAAKEAFRLAFEAIGGVDALTAWASDHPSEFYKLYARLIPTEHGVTGVDQEPLTVNIKFVGPREDANDVDPAAGPSAGS